MWTPGGTNARARGGRCHRYTVEALFSAVRAPGVSLALLASLSFGACTWAFDWEHTQCTVGADCAAFGADFEGALCVEGRCERVEGGAAGAGGAGGSGERWACVGRPAEASPGAYVTVSGVARDVSGLRLAGVSVRACNLFDVDCTKPVSGLVVTDATGSFSLEAPAALRGYLELTAEGTVPVLAVRGPFDTDTDFGDVVLPQRELVEQMHAFITGWVGRTESFDEVASIYAYIYDCEGQPVAGAQVAFSDPGTSQTVYFKNGVPDISASKTDDDGIAGILLARPGVNSMIVGMADGSEEVESLGVVMRKGHLTEAMPLPKKQATAP